MSTNPFDQFDGQQANPFDEFDAQPAPAAKKSRTWGQAAKDTALSVVGGLNSLAKLPAMAIDKMATGNAMGPGVQALNEFGDSIQRDKSQLIQDEAAQASQRTKARAQAVEDGFDRLMGTQGQYSSARSVSKFLTELGSGAYEGLSNPRLLADQVAQAMPMLRVSQVAGRAAGGLAEKVIPAAAAKVATGGAVGAGAAMQGADVGTEAFQRLMDQPDEAWAQDAEYRERAKSVGFEQAKQELASERATAAALKAGAASVASSFLPGGTAMEKALVSKSMVPSLKGVAQGFAGEFAQEAIEEGAGQYLQNQAVATVDRKLNPMEGVGEAAGMGGAVGGFMGGAGTGGRMVLTALQERYKKPGAAAPSKPVLQELQERKEPTFDAPQPAATPDNVPQRAATRGADTVAAEPSREQQLQVLQGDMEAINAQLQEASEEDRLALVDVAQEVQSRHQALAGEGDAPLPPLALSEEQLAQAMVAINRFRELDDALARDWSNTRREDAGVLPGVSGVLPGVQTPGVGTALEDASVQEVPSATADAAEVTAKPAANTAKPAPLPRPTVSAIPGATLGTVLEGKAGPGFDADVIKRASDLVQRSGKASVPALARELGVSPKQAQGLLEQLQAAGVVSAPNAMGGRTVLAKSTEQGLGGKPIEARPAGARGTQASDVVRPQPADAPTVDPGQQWDAMPIAQRQAMLGRFMPDTDAPQRYGARPWASFNVGERSTMKALMEGAQKPAVDKESLSTQPDEVGERIQAAIKAGVELTQADQDAIRQMAGRAAEFRKRADRTAGRGADPMNKGNAFPMGVGFTKMTKRSEQRLDASVKRAGEAVELWKKAEQAEKQVEALLQGKDTEADKAKKAARKLESQRELVRRLVNWKKGDKIGAFTIERVNKDRDGYPGSYTISGEGVIKGVMDKVDVARDFFGGSKEALRAMVDEVRAQPAAEATHQKAPAKREPFEHAGLKVYPARFKRGEQTIEGWAVQSPDNKGTDKVLGDTLHETVDAAKKEAELLARHAAERAETRAKIDAQEKAEAAEREAKKEANKGKSLQERRADNILAKVVSENGQQMTRRDWVTKKVGEGLEPSVTQEDKIKPLSRAQFNRATNEEQRAHDQRVKAAGKKDVFWLGDYEVSKTEHDLAVRLRADQPAAATHQDPGEAPEAVTPAVVKESLIKAAKNEDRKPSQMKADLLRMIDEAIAKAPDTPTRGHTTEPRTVQGREEFHGIYGDVRVDVRRGNDNLWHVTDPKVPHADRFRKPLALVPADGPAAARKAVEALMARASVKDGRVVLGEPDTVTFDVPGDGKFKILNDRERLADFRKKVEASAGFKDKAPTAPAAPRLNSSLERYGVEGGSASAKAAIEAMIDEGDAQAAVDYAAAKGVPLDFLSPARKGKVSGLKATGEEDAPAKADPKPWELTRDEFMQRVEYRRDGNGSNPWSANWNGAKIQAPGEEFDHPDLGKTVASGGFFHKTKRDASITAMAAHQRAVRRAILNGEAVPEHVRAPYDLAAKKAAPEALTATDGMSTSQAVAHWASERWKTQSKLDDVLRQPETAASAAEAGALRERLRQIEAKQAEASEAVLAAVTKKKAPASQPKPESTAPKSEAPSQPETEAADTWQRMTTSEREAVLLRAGEPRWVGQDSRPSIFAVRLAEKRWGTIGQTARDKIAAAMEPKAAAPAPAQAPATETEPAPEAPSYKNAPPEEAADARPVARQAWDGMSAEQRADVAKAAGWATAKGTPNPQARAIARKTWAEQTDSTRKRLADAIEASGADLANEMAPAPDGWELATGLQFVGSAEAEAARLNGRGDGYEYQAHDGAAIIRRAKPVAAEAKPVPPADRLQAESDLWARVRDGQVTPEEFKAAFADYRASKEAITTALGKLTKPELLKMLDFMGAQRYRGENKPEVVEAVYREGLSAYTLARSFQWGMGRDAYAEGIARMVDATDAATLADYAQRVADARAAAKARAEKISEAIQEPKSLEDFRLWMRATMEAGGKTFRQAYLELKPEQRAEFDRLAAADSRGQRKELKDAQRTEVRVAGQTVGGQIIETKHTQKGHDLFVVQLAERVAREDYDTLNASAKRLGGYYSSFRGRGAVPGFQFTTREQAQAFVKLAQGDKAEAQELAKERRDAFEDDRSQSAAERLTEMAERLQERADESRNRERKVNTDRRARFAASAEAAANEAESLARTMRNMAAAIAEGKAQMLDRVRQKTQVEALRDDARRAWEAEQRAAGKTYADFESGRVGPMTPDSAAHAEWPLYQAFRSDLAGLARKLLAIDGHKLLGQKLMRLADDVSAAYLKFAKENLHQLQQFRSRDTGELAGFSTEKAAELAIIRSGLLGQAMPYKVKRGEYALIVTPSEAQQRGLWKGDADARLNLDADLGAELVEKLGKLHRRPGAARNASIPEIPWQLQRAHDRRAVLARMGIETPAEHRAALREFISLREAPKALDRVAQMERAMVGRRNDGFDFFPTPEGAADEMVAAADLQPGMRVLEPSAGMGHIAERIRAAGIEADVVEIAQDRRELLEAKGFNLVGRDFLELSATDAPAVQRADLEALEAHYSTRGDVLSSVRGAMTWFDKGDMRGAALMLRRAERQGEFNPAALAELDGMADRLEAMAGSRYDRILMNPPFSDRRDAEHVRHAYSLLKPGGRLVAIVGEGVFFGKDKQAQAFRDWLDELGATNEKLPEGTFLDPSLPVNTGVSARMVVIDKPAGAQETPGAEQEATADAVMSRRQAIDFEKEDSAVDVLLAWGAQAETQYARTESTDLGEIALLKGATAMPVTRTQMDGSEKPTGDWEITLPAKEGQAQKVVTLTETEREVWISVPNTLPGEGGSRVYDIAAQYALNTGKVFKGDPAGLSAAALRRRLENMLSSAIKYGTTDHLAPHPDQRKGDPGAGVPALDWHTGDTRANIMAMLRASIAANEHNQPFGSLIDYDAGAGVFRAAGGDAVFSAEDIARLADGDRGVSGAGAAGHTTLQRAALFRALLRGPAERRSLLDKLHPVQGDGGARPGRGAPELDRLLYSKGGPGAQGRVSGIAHADLQALAERVAASLPNAPKIHVLNHPSELPDLDLQERISSAGAWGDVEGVLSGGEIFLFAEHMASLERAEHVLAEHEIAHAGLRSMLGRSMQPTMQALYNLNASIRKAAEAKMRDEGLPLHIAVEEVLVDVPTEQLPQLKGWRRFVQRLADGLRLRGYERLAKALDQVLMAGGRDLATAGLAGDLVRAGRGWMAGSAEAKAAGQLGSKRLKALDATPEDAGHWPTGAPVGAMSRGAEDLRMSRTSDKLSSQAADLFSAVTAPGFVKSMQDRLIDFVRTSQSFNLWHRTVGTQFHKAQVNRHFGRVFGAAQAYINDVSFFANEAADLAPSILPKLDKLGDVVKRLALTREDQQKVADALFGGTLQDRIWTPSELVEQGLNEEQIGLYSQARAAIDKSLDLLVAGDVMRHLGRQKEELPPHLAELVRRGEVEAFGRAVRETVRNQVQTYKDEAAALAKEQTRERANLAARRRRALEKATVTSKLAIQQRFDEEAKQLAFEQGGPRYRAEEKLALWEQLESQMLDKFVQIDNLKASGYAPLMRFGKFAIRVDEAGQVPGEEPRMLSFHMRDREADANKLARELQAKHPGATVSVSPAPQLDTVFSGMDPEVLSLFADKLSMDDGQRAAFEQYVKLAASNRSALKRLIKRKGIEGYSEEVSRVLAAFITSNARQTSAAVHMGELDAAVDAVPKGQGDVKDEARRLQKYVKEPTEEAQALRGAMFVWFIGGSLASALVNMTQPVTMSYPWLTQFAGLGGAAKALGQASADLVALMGKKGATVLDPDLAKALERADKEGITAPSEVHQLQAEVSRGLGTHPAIRKGLFLWGLPFQYAEHFNRRVSFIAAYRVAVQQEMPDPFAFAERAVDETQGLYNKGNRPDWARGAAGATLFTFKQFSIHYMEWLVRMWQAGAPGSQERRNGRRAVGMALLVLVMMAGLQGLPGADDLDDVIDGVGQRLGYDTNSKRWKEQLLASLLGETGAAFAMRGLSVGTPLDVAGRLSLGNLVPGTGTLLKKEDRSRDLAELAGPAGSFLADSGKAVGQLAEGDLWEAIKTASPKAVGNLLKGGQMLATGEYTDSRDREVIKTGPADAVVKMVGFQPSKVAAEQRLTGAIQQSNALTKLVEQEIAHRWAVGIKERDEGRQMEARKALADWNRKNPERPIRISRTQLMGLVRQMSMDKRQRLLKGAPKELRRQTAEELGD